MTKATRDATVVALATENEQLRTQVSQLKMDHESDLQFAQAEHDALVSELDLTETNLLEALERQYKEVQYVGLCVEALDRNSRNLETDLLELDQIASHLSDDRENNQAFKAQICSYLGIGENATNQGVIDAILAQQEIKKKKKKSKQKTKKEK